MSGDACIRVERDGAIARIVIHQPARRNALSHAMWRELGDALESLAGDDGVRVAILTGAGERAFSAGADISEFDTLRATPQLSARYDATSQRAAEALDEFPKPVIARIRGYCVGGGMELALLCDIRIASDDARFAITPARLGLGYGLADTQRMVRRLGAPAVREILFTARLFEPAEALRLGIVSQVTATAELDAAVNACASAIAANAPLTVRAAKAIICEAEKPPGERDEALCQRLVDACTSSADYVEGRRAFAEKRAPRFTGR